MPPLPASRAKIVRPDTESEADDLYDYPSEVEINEPPNDFNAYAKCIFGHKAAGKTTLAASFPKSLTLMFEPVRKGLRIRQLLLPKVTAKQIREGATDVWVKVLRTTPRWLDDESVGCLNFDSIDIFYECCCASIFARNKVNHPDDIKNGSGIWNEVRDEWASYFSALRETRLGNYNMLSHVKGRETTELDGSKIKGIHAPSCSPACLQYIRQAVDFIFFLGSHNGQRAVLIRDDTNMSFVAVSPEGVFLQPNGKKISILQMPEKDEQPNAGYNRLVDAFHNKCWDIDTPAEERTTEPAKASPRRLPPKR